MNSNIDEGAIRKLLIAFALVAIIVSGTVLTVSFSDSEGSVEEQIYVTHTLSGPESAYITDSSGTNIVRFQLVCVDGSPKMAYHAELSNANSAYTGYYLVARTWNDGNNQVDGSSGTEGMSLSYFTAATNKTFGGTHFLDADDYIAVDYRICTDWKWDNQVSGTGTIHIEIKTTGTLQYAYTTTITYDANGGENAPAKTETETKTSATYPVGVESVKVSDEVPTRDGHTFRGWSTSKSGEPSIMPGSVQTLDQGADLTVYAQWKIKTSKLCLLSAGSTFKTLIADWGSEVTVPTDVPTRSGFTFIGWSATDGAETADYYAGSKLTLKDDLNLYAVWDMDPVTYTLSFDANGGEGIPDPMTRTTEDERCVFTIPSTLPERDGYKCMGWSSSASGELEYVPGDEISIPYDTPNTTLYACWKEYIAFTITFDANGGQNAPSPASGRTLGEPIDIRVTLDEPVRSGYKFLGWASDADATVATVQPGQSVRVEGNTTLYAVWQKQPVVYSLKFDANGGEGVPTATAIRTSASSASITVPAGTPEWEGHAFQGWSTSKTSVVAEYEAGDSVNLTEDQPIIALYAVWWEMTLYTLSFDANGGEDAPAPVTAWSLGISYDMIVPADAPTSDLCRFVGWAASEDAELADVERGGTYRMTEPSVTLFAVWEWTTKMTFSLTFDVGEGTGAPQSLSGTAVAPSLTFDVPSDVPTLDGYEFAGWSLSEDAEVADYAAGDRIVLTSESTVLHAVWKLIVSYTIGFDANNGQNAPASVTGTSTSGSCELTVPETEPARSEYRFLGWSVSKETVTPEIEPGQVLTVTEDVTLYAIWNEVVTFTLSFDANGGEDAPASVSDDSDAGSCALAVLDGIPTKAGHTFQGWSRDKQATEAEYQPGASVTLTVRSLTLYAIWQIFPYVEFSGQSEIDVIVNTTETSTVSWTPANATIVADGPSWIHFDNGTITINAPAYEDVGVLTLTATHDGCTETVWTLTVRAIPPEDAALVTFKGNGATDSFAFAVQGGKLTAPSEPTRDGFAFAGWYTQQGEKYDFEAPVTGSMVLVAHWDDAGSGDSSLIAWILAGILAVVIGFVVVRRFI